MAPEEALLGIDFEPGLLQSIEHYFEFLKMIGPSIKYRRLVSVALGLVVGVASSRAAASEEISATTS